MFTVVVMVLASSVLLPFLATGVEGAGSAASMEHARFPVQVDAQLSMAANSTFVLCCLALAAAEFFVMLSVQSLFTVQARNYANVFLRVAPKLVAFAFGLFNYGNAAKAPVAVRGDLAVLGSFDGLIIMVALVWGSVVHMVGSRVTLQPSAFLRCPQQCFILDVT